MISVTANYTRKRGIVRTINKSWANDAVVMAAEDYTDSIEPRDKEERFDRAIERGIVESISPQIMRRYRQRVTPHVQNERKATNATDRREIVRELSEFHLMLGEICGNRVLSEILANLMVRSSLIVALYQRNDVPSCASDEHEEILDALSEAHDRGIIHRDLKPDNVFLQQTAGKDIHAKLLDFGIAKALGERHERPATETGVAKGTPPYMSPEQLRAETLTPASDLFAMGCVVYQLATGKLLFDGPSTPAVVLAIVQVQQRLAGGDIQAAADARVPGLGWVLERCLQAKPEDRYASAAALRSALLDLRGRLGGGEPRGALDSGRARCASVCRRGGVHHAR